MVPDKAQALARSISVSAAPVAASHAVVPPLGHLDLETASLAAFRNHKDGLGVGGRQLVAEPAAFSRCSDDSRASNEVSAHAATMLDLVGRLLGADLIALTLVGPPDRSFVRDAAGLRPGARCCAHQCLVERRCLIGLRESGAGLAYWGMRDTLYTSLESSERLLGQ